ncbi:MAG: phosphoribosylformylglycinamidine synthase subunit PurQ [Acidobacteria bacterium]|nr:phosphoribosylformylglycinamidine synthase subunit PurQ [Acidobacteriota bacterium]MBE3126490.1 phosphoribosylformylglycinamidine synthase subunit PurQ [Acidobacteriota bacterium]MBE3130824.1 phosphoribosylformylglycinamidine synthase subunit PurQ [Acidobacteriota bacterium]
MKFGVVQFPGSNCDFDTFHVLRNVMKRETALLWHKDHDLQGVDCVVLPGGFSYGDYLRSGAIARFSPLMQEVKAFARAGGHVLGICNGFQILLELGLLPGAMIRNKNLKFLCQHVHIRIENEKTDFTRAGRKGQVLRIPIAHFDGNYYAAARVLKDIERHRQVVFRYCDAEGNITEEANVNGSLGNIAGIRNREGNVLGLMPHPERASEALLGSKDGRTIFASLILSLERRKPARRPVLRERARHD